jgi:flavoprotein hydroxylase
VDEHCDVVIVGCGPVGGLLAILLAQRGWRVVVLERWPKPYPLPRAVHFDHEIGRIFQDAGIADAVRAQSEPGYTYEWRNPAGEVLVRFGRENVASLSGWPDSNMFHQPDLERVIERRIGELPNVALHRGVEVFQVADAGDRVHVRARDSAGEVCEVEARWAIGCDGANSFVRRAMHVPVEDTGLDFDWLIVDVVMRRERRFRPKNFQLCDPMRPTTVISGGPGRRRFEFMVLPDETCETLNDSRVAWALLHPFEVTPENAVLERHSVYSFRARWAEQWRVGRQLLAGDAAHFLPPFAGQGMSSGLRDAATLAWQLDLVLSQRAPELLLDTYAQERLVHVRSLIDLSISLGRVMCMTNPDEATARDAQLMALVAANQRAALPSPPTMGPGTTLAGDRYAGELFVQGRVHTQVDGDVRVGLFDDVVGRGWVLLGADRDPLADLTPGQRSFFASLRGVSVHVGADAPVVDLDGRYAAYFERTGRRVVLQRPDFHVFGTGKDAADAGALVDALAQQLASPEVREES